MQLLGLKSFRAAAIMLVGLLLYDVFWVFGSPAAIGENVMLTVATSDVLTGPTRLLFPRPAGSVGEASAFPFSLLGAPFTFILITGFDFDDHDYLICTAMLYSICGCNTIFMVFGGWGSN